MRRIALAALTAVLAVCGTAVAPAQAEVLRGIGVVTPSTAKVGEPQVIRVGGTAVPSAEWWDLSYVEVVAMWADVIPNCPADAQSGAAVAETANGAILAIAMRANVDELGYSSTPSASPGRRRARSWSAPTSRTRTATPTTTTGRSSKSSARRRIRPPAGAAATWRAAKAAGAGGRRSTSCRRRSSAGACTSPASRASGSPATAATPPAGCSTAAAPTSPRARRR
jgi:hypothetical protein